MDKTLDTTSIDLILTLLELPDDVEAEGDEAPKLPIYLKYAVRCLTSCVRFEKGVDRLVSNGQGMPTILALLQKVREEEVVANVAKIIRLTMRSKKHFDDLITKHPDIGNILLDTLNLYTFSEVVQDELISTLRIVTRSI